MSVRSVTYIRWPIGCDIVILISKKSACLCAEVTVSSMLSDASIQYRRFAVIMWSEALVHIYNTVFCFLEAVKVTRMTPNVEPLTLNEHKNPYTRAAFRSRHYEALHTPTKYFVSLKQSIQMYDAKCPDWDQVLLNSTRLRLILTCIIDYAANLVIYPRY